METASPGAAIRAWPIWLPCSALVPVGLLARLEAPPALAIACAGVAVALAGVAFAWTVARLITRRVPRGIGVTAVVVNLALLSVSGVAVARGVAERRAEEARAEQLRQAQLAARDLAGWVGGTVVGGASIQAREIAPASELGRMLRESFDEPFIPVVFTVDNRGPQELVVDLTQVTVRHADGTQRPVRDRARVIASARDHGDDLQAVHAGVYRVPAGARLGSGLVFVSPDERLDQVVAFELTVDGKPVELSGRFLTADQKRALRERAPRR